MLVPQRLLTPKPLRSRRGSRPNQRRLPNQRHLLVEPLEHRTLLATVTWDGGAGTFNWNDAANWDTDALPGATDDAVIPDLAGTPTITHPSGIHTIASLTSGESFTLFGGTLIVNGPLSFQGTFTLSGGATLRTALVSGDTGALMQVTSSDGTLDGVTLGVNSTLREGAQVTVLNGLTLANGVTLRLEHPTANFNNAALDVGLNFAGGVQTLGGSGTVELFRAVSTNQFNPAQDDDVRVRPSAGGSLTIGPGITIHNAAGSDLTSLGDTALPLILQGTVSAQSTGRTLRINASTVTNTGILESLAGELDVNHLTGNVNGTSITNGDLDLDGTYTFNQPVSLPAGSGSLTLRGTWTNASTITQSGGTIHLGGIFRVADLGAFVGTAGTVSVFGTLDDPGATLSINAARTWRVAGGTLRGITVAGPADSLLQLVDAVLAGADTVLDGVTLGVNTTLREGTLTVTNVGNQVSVLNGLTLAGGVTLRLEHPTANFNNAARDVGLNFAGGVQTLGGSGTVELFRAVSTNQFNPAEDDDVRVRPSAGGSLTIGPGITVHNAAGSDLTSLGDPALPLILQGTVSAQSAGRTLRVTGSTVTNLGILQTSNNGTIHINQSVNIDESGILAGLGWGAITIAGDLVGDTRNADLYNPRGTVRFEGSGSSTAPQLLEAMGRDLGAASSGFVKNFVYGTLALAGNTYVRLVDQDDNGAGTEAEALYVNTLVVPAGTTLDLNGLNVYVRAMQLDGTVTGGAVTWAPDGNTLDFASPTPGVIATAGEVDEWQFFRRGGRAVTVVVNPGSTELSPLPPRLNFAQVQLIDPAGNVLASGQSPSSGAVVTLRDVVIPADGTYTIRIGATAAQPGRTGSYLVTLWDSTTDVAPLMLGRSHIGGIETPYSQDRWVFSASAGQQVRFDLLSNAAPGTMFSLSGPAGFTGFSGLVDDSDLITLTHSGTYILTATAGPSGQTGAYAFQLVQTSLVDLTLGTPYQGLIAGTNQALLFRVNVPEGSPLRVHLDDSTGTNRNEVYLRFGTPPTRGDYQFRDTAPAADQTLVVSQASSGTWFILVYSAAVPTPGAFTITAETEDLVLTSVTPDHHGNGADMVMTLSGAGFHAPMTLVLVDPNGATFPAAAVEVDLPTQLTATFMAGIVPAGVYTVRARLANGATADLPSAFSVDTGGQANLVTNLVLPSAVGRHALATIYVEYANTGTVAMPAPLLVLRGDDGALMTLDQSRITAGFWTSAVPEGFGDTIQFLGSGATPGVLQPGERMQVPVYYAGLLQPWDFSDTSVDFHLEVLRTDNATPIDWQVIGANRPTSISPDAWNPIFTNLQSQVGATWGDYVRMLDDNAAYLGRLGQRVLDVGDLWSFEVQQASGLSPVSRLAAVTDAYVEAPGMPITFGRVYSPGIDERFELNVLGRGWAWSGGWTRLLTVNPSDQTVTVSDTCGCGSNASRGSARIFQPDSRRAGVYFAQAGDNATLTKLSGGTYELREASGLVTRFRSDGRVDYVQDTNGNRITTTWTSGRLTRLSHSAGQFLDIGYNAAGRVSGLLDSTGRTVVYSYDAVGEHLMSATGSDGRTTRYTYSAGAGAAQEHAMRSIEYPDGTHEFFTYDSRGRLASVTLDGNAQPVIFSYDSGGRVTGPNAADGATSYLFDHLGRIAAVEDALGNRTVLGFDGLNLTRVTDALGQEYAYSYDSRGNMTRSTDPLGHTTTFSYTASFNQLATVTDARGNALKYGYDARGNLISITYADNSVERFAVDAQGNVDAYTNRRGQVVDASYDASGRLSRQDFPDGSFVEYRYNSRGNLERAISEDGMTLVEYLDPLNPNLPTKITYPNGRFLAYTYQNGRRTSLIHPDGFTVNYLYDAIGRLEFLRDGNNNLIVQYHYDAAGQLERKSNGTYTEYQYDLAGNTLHLINYAPDSSINSRFDYAYDALGRRTQMTTLEGVWDYTYDGIGQLTRAVFTSNNTAVISHQDLTYVYDAVGNRVRTVINGTTTEYTTNNLNQYIQVGAARYTYDLDGNLIARVDGAVTETFTYDAVNRLVGVDTPAGTWDYEYDGFHNRSATVANGQRTEYLIDPFGLGDVAAEYDSSGLVARYVHAFGSLISGIIGSGVATYYDFDALGSTVGLTGAAGGYVNRYSYRPFGERLVSEELVPNPFEFVGAFGVMQGETGLDFMRARFYSSIGGRFVSQDPVGLNSGNVNTYSYFHNNPLEMTDSSGLTDDQLQQFECNLAILQLGISTAYRDFSPQTPLLGILSNAFSLASAISACSPKLPAKTRDGSPLCQIFFPYIINGKSGIGTTLVRRFLIGRPTA